MNKDCKNSFAKVKKLIEREKENLMSDNVQPDIQELDGAVLLQYFENWDLDKNFSKSTSNNEFEYLHKPINLLNNFSGVKSAKLCYNKLQTINEFHILNNQTLIMLDGCAEIYQHETDETTIIDPNSLYEFNKDDIIDFKTTCENNYYILIVKE